jgi:hydrogenase maturation protein HypF
MPMLPTTEALSIRVGGVVQGVGFRPFVFRLAHEHALAGWVRNAGDGVEIYLEGPAGSLDAFLRDLEAQAPPAARIAAVDVARATACGAAEFKILDSDRDGAPTVRISPDLPVCGDCLRELFDPADPRYRYPYINCTNCGPRYTILLGLPYDRHRTTMQGWPMDARCAAQYHDPADRRFHAQPVACPACGPRYLLDGAAELLRSGAIVAIKGLGGYHLACDASNAAAVSALRERKFRKEKPFAVMARDLDSARALVELSVEAEAALTSLARPIVLAPARRLLDGVAPDTGELGVMLPYTPVHHLLFADGAPDPLVMTSANRSNEPIAFTDADAFEQLDGIADAFLVGERPIARRVDDSVVRVGVLGPTILRRARGYAPGAVARLPVERPILALGADLKNTVTLVVDGQAFVSHHLGDLEHYPAFHSFTETIRDLTAMYDIAADDLLVVHDCHPQYASTVHAARVDARERRAVQHHRAHIASVLAEREAWDERVVGVAFDGTGYGDDGGIWGGEIFTGSVAAGFARVAHLRGATLPGGDAAARYPVQAAAGFIRDMDLSDPPFSFPDRFRHAAGIRSFPTTSAGRLFDTAAALAGFTRGITFEGQAAMWLEHLASGATDSGAYPFPLDGDELDYRPLLGALIDDRRRGVDPAVVARRFHRGVAHGVCDAIVAIGIGTVVLSGGVFQNQLLLRDVKERLDREGFTIWTNHAVPPNDGGISLGQAALAAVGRFDQPHA